MEHEHMAEPTPPGRGDGAERESEPHVPPGMPRWVKAVGLVVGIGILLVILLQLVGGGEHGPGRHGASGTALDHAEDTTAIEGAPEVPLTAGSLRFDPDRLELPTGVPVNVALTSTDVFHDLVVDQIDFHLAADRDDTTVGGLVFDEPGTYVAYCSVPGHREAGMELELVVGDHVGLEEFFRELHG
jgi:plastocyanin